MNRTDPDAPPPPTHFEDGPDEPARPGPRSIVRCLNCDHPVDGRFCGHCGQQRLLRPLSLGALLWDLAIEVLDTDARVWRTLRTLIRQPGQLTLDWVAGPGDPYEASLASIVVILPMLGIAAVLNRPGRAG